jgi:hypothetical protein
MIPPIFVRSPSEKKRASLGGGAALQIFLRDAPMPDTLASSRGQSPPKFARSLGCGSQIVRNAIHDFNDRSLLALTPGSSRPKRVHAAFDEECAEALISTACFAYAVSCDEPLRTSP